MVLLRGYSESAFWFNSPLQRGKMWLRLLFLCSAVFKDVKLPACFVTETLRKKKKKKIETGKKKKKKHVEPLHLVQFTLLTCCLLGH